MIKFVVNGIGVDDELLMVDEIHKVGAFGDFLSLDSTYRHMREQSQPRLLDRRVREEWQADGATDLYARSLAKAREIIETHGPSRSTPTLSRRCVPSWPKPTRRGASDVRSAVPDPLFEQMKTAVIEGNGDLLTALTPVLLAQGKSAREILDGALLPGMEVVGARMKSGDCFRLLARARPRPLRPLWPGDSATGRQARATSEWQEPGGESPGRRFGGEPGGVAGRVVGRRERGSWRGPADHTVPKMKAEG